MLVGLMSLRVLIVDDNIQFLDAARGLLDRQGLAVVGVASTSIDALRRAGELRPDVILVDVDLGDESGLDLAQRLTQLKSADGANVILISAYPKEDVAELLDASTAIAFLSKSELSGSAIAECVSAGED
jgi:DNA-binding NarL/FixJ family response regulator